VRQLNRPATRFAVPSGTGRAIPVTLTARARRALRHGPLRVETAIDIGVARVAGQTVLLR
jgi:hypothetical protein